MPYIDLAQGDVGNGAALRDQGLVDGVEQRLLAPAPTVGTGLGPAGQKWPLPSGSCLSPAHSGAGSQAQRDVGIRSVLISKACLPRLSQLYKAELCRAKLTARIWPLAFACESQGTTLCMLLASTSSGIAADSADVQILKWWAL